MFLSANNFFWRVERDGDVIVKASRWRDLGRAEAALVGVQYRTYQRNRPRLVGRPALARTLVAVRRHGATPWIGVLAWRRRDRPDRGGVAAGRATRRGDPEALRAWPVRADDVLRDAWRRKGVRRGRVPPHPRRHVRPVVWRMLENLWMRLARDD